MEIQQQQAPSLTSSPSHEFSFTISFNSPSPPNLDKAKTHQPSSAVDLTPADDIFFHGHLLPLHVMSNLPVSPRSSTNSLDSFTLPIRELLHDETKPHDLDSCVCSSCDKSKHHSFNSYEYRRSHDHEQSSSPTKKQVKSKSFSLFGLPRRRKDGESSSSENQNNKKRMKFDVGHFVKKYIRMFSRGRREQIEFRSKQPYSFSGKLDSREGKMSLNGRRRREFSAPASIRTSPTNSGVLRMANPQSPSDSTMEELQAAIQAAIAHCKNSIATADKA